MGNVVKQEWHAQVVDLVPSACCIRWKNVQHYLAMTDAIIKQIVSVVFDFNDGGIFVMSE